MIRYDGPPRLPTEISTSALEDMFHEMLVDNGLSADTEGLAILKAVFFSGAASMLTLQEKGRKIAETHGSDSARIFQLIHEKLEKEVAENVRIGVAPVIGYKPRS